MTRRYFLSVTAVSLALVCTAGVAAADCASFAASAGDAEVVTLAVPGMT